jgi:hypothetical protein
MISDSDVFHRIALWIPERYLWWIPTLVHVLSSLVACVSLFGHGTCCAVEIVQIQCKPALWIALRRGTRWSVECQAAPVSGPQHGIQDQHACSPSAAATAILPSLLAISILLFMMCYADLNAGGTMSCMSGATEMRTARRVSGEHRM